VTPAAFTIPGDIGLPTGGYMYDRRVLALQARFGVAMRHVVLPGSFPDPSAADIEEAGRLLAAVAPGDVVMVDGLAYGAMPAEVIERARAPIVALVHHPLCLEAGLAKGRQDALRALEKAALALARRVVVTSQVTARTLVADFAVPADKITVAEPGTDPAPRARRSTAGAPIQLLSVGAIVPRKAYDILVRALGTLKDQDWRLTIAGPTDRSPEALAALHAAIRATGLADRVTLAGPVDRERLADLYASADAFLMASLYEGYGMVLAEAMARGLPIVCTTGGAAAETVPDDAALKVPPGDEQALSLAIGRVLQDTGLRRRMSDASWAAGQGLPRWEETARIIAGVIEEIGQ
jgi:glycosyltransferase involved in cell wall biosynthesis